MSIPQTVRRSGPAVMLLLVAAMAWGRAETMEQDLPVFAPYRCANCHTATLPTANDLNAFGRDYRDFGPWGELLATMDSDGDGCTNGAEIGDIDGNGQIDDGVTQESSNPGIAGDCSSAIAEALSWGKLKAIFDGQR